MKKVLLSAVVLMMAVASFAAGVKMDGTAYTQISALVANKDSAGWKTFLLTLDAPTPENKIYVITSLMGADFMGGTKVANLSAVQTLVAGYATQYGVTDARVIQSLVLRGMYDACDLCFGAGILKADAYAYFKTVPNPTDDDKVLGTYLAYYNGDVAEALTLGESCQIKDYMMLVAISANNPVKCFEYSKKALLSQTCSVAQVTDILTRLWAFDFSDTTITPQMRFDMLCDVNDKYSKMLTIDKPLWEPIITKLQTAISNAKLRLK